jgi:poly(hydroxyalkanoate) granule-associated protein
MTTKTKPTVVVEEIANGKERNPVLDISRKVLMAGIGAVALAQDEIEEFVNKLVERGEIAEKDGKKLIREVMDKRKSTTKKADDELGKRVEGVLDRINVPSKADIEELSDKITALTKKIDELKKEKV